MKTDREKMDVMAAHILGSRIVCRSYENGNTIHFPIGSPPGWNWTDYDYDIYVEPSEMKWQPSNGEYNLYNYIPDSELREYGYLFENPDSAIEARNVHKKHNRLYKLAIELNDGWTPIENQYQMWCIAQSPKGLIALRVNKNAMPICGIFFKDFKTANLAINIINNSQLD